MNKQEADVLITAIRSLLEPEDRKPAKQCDHKFVGSNNCAKCGTHVSAIEAAKKPVGLVATLDRQVLEGTDNVGGVSKPFADKDVEAQYQAFKNRMIEDAAIDPVLLHLLTSRPELVVHVERRVVELNGTGGDLKGRIARLIAADFFTTPRRATDINTELKKTGSEAAGNRMSEALDFFKKAGFLVREENVWTAAPGIKVTSKTIEV